MSKKRKTIYYVTPDGMQWAICSRTWTRDGWRLSRHGTERTRHAARSVKRKLDQGEGA